MRWWFLSPLVIIITPFVDVVISLGLAPAILILYFFISLYLFHTMFIVGNLILHSLEFSLFLNQHLIALPTFVILRSVFLPFCAKIIIVDNPITQVLESSWLDLSVVGWQRWMYNSTSFRIVCQFRLRISLQSPPACLLSWHKWALEIGISATASTSTPLRRLSTRWLPYRWYRIVLLAGAESLLLVAKSLFHLNDAVGHSWWWLSLSVVILVKWVPLVIHI